jgi:catechol 2,3-dioxygenase-like lactoylglutathione lyase family enzyme
MARPTAAAVPAFHHVGVQTTDLANSTAWYAAFFGADESWSLSRFSELTRSRLPGITRLVELVVGDVRLHLFERAGRPAPAPAESVTGFQHVCFAVDSPQALGAMRQRWTELYESGRFRFAVAVPATPVVVDDDGVHSFYAYDVNGVEFEFTYVPRAT